MPAIRTALRYAINDLGQAVGATGKCGPFNAIEQNNLTPLHAVLWRNGNAINLGNLGGDGKFAGIYATGLNDDGQVVGTSDTTGDASFHGFLWHQGHITDLGTLTGDAYSSAIAISKRRHGAGRLNQRQLQPAGRALAQRNRHRHEYSGSSRHRFVPGVRMLHQRQRRDHRICSFEEQPRETHAYLAKPVGTPTTKIELPDLNNADGGASPVPAFRSTMQTQDQLVPFSAAL